jgi:hypothetical protein
MAGFGLFECGLSYLLSAATLIIAFLVIHNNQ